jgi:hypothetical protein
MKPFHPLHAVLIAALLAALPAQAQIYQYKDASGKTVLSDRPPPTGGMPAKTHSAGGVVNGEESAKSLAERDLEFKKRQQEQREAADKAQKQAADKATRAEDCERARRQLQLLESGERIATRDAQGEHAFMEDDQRAAEIGRARKFIAEVCK